MNGLITCVLVSNFADNIKSCIKAGSPNGYGSLRSRKIFGFENLKTQNTASVEYNFDQYEDFPRHANGRHLSNEFSRSTNTRAICPLEVKTLTKRKTEYAA